MREILFRGKASTEWVYGDLRHINDGRVAVRKDGEIYPYEVIPETVGQYTGLTDKNGRRIFEGDICQHEKTGRTISVSWHGTMAGYVWSKRIEDSHLFDFGELFRVHDKYAVIGNIHDNPELLEVR